MKAYRVIGKFEMGWIRNQTFVKEIAAKNPKAATEIILSEIGSKHKVKRKQIKIEKIEEIPLDQVKSQVVKKLVGDAK